MLLDLVFPPRCMGCGAARSLVCSACLPSVGVIVPPLCARCGRPWPEPVPRCRDCPPAAIDLARSPFLYEGPVAAAIRAMKFGSAHAVTRRLAAAMVSVVPDPAAADAVCWVPLSRRRRRRRGFDQAEILARGVARLLGASPLSLLRRRRDTPPQARLGPAERRAALRHAFVPRRPAPGAVLLVDDVLTTGTTAASCAAALRSAGAERVVLLTAARAVPGPVPPGAFGRPSG